MRTKGEQREDLTDDRRFDDDQKRERSKQTFVYKDAGLTECHGYIPRWLWVVVVVLVIWGGYYLITYWESPGGY
jgi:hypothetical protein